MTIRQLERQCRWQLGNQKDNVNNNWAIRKKLANGARKDDVHDEDEDGGDLEGQRQGTVVIVEGDGGQGGQYCAHYYEHPSLSKVFQDGRCEGGQVDLRHGRVN